MQELGTESKGGENGFTQGGGEKSGPGQGEEDILWATGGSGYDQTLVLFWGTEQMRFKDIGSQISYRWSWQLQMVEKEKTRWWWTGTGCIGVGLEFATYRDRPKTAKRASNRS